MNQFTVIDVAALLVGSAAVLTAAHPDLVVDVLRFVGTAIGTFTGIFMYGMWRERKRRINRLRSR